LKWFPKLDKGRVIVAHGAVAAGISADGCAQAGSVFRGDLPVEFHGQVEPGDDPWRSSEIQ
jgi:hypothetical protein